MLRHTGSSVTTGANLKGGRATLSLLAVAMLLALAGARIIAPPVEAQTTPPLTIQAQTGRVGIGTTTPGYTLDVNGTVSASELRLLNTPVISSQWTTSGSSISYSGGNVGIGTTGPGALVHLYGGTANTVLKLETASGYVPWVSFKNKDATVRWQWQDTTVTGGPFLGMYDEAGTAWRFVVQQAGNVGIGTTSPTLPLHVITNTASTTVTGFMAGTGGAGQWAGINIGTQQVWGGQLRGIQETSGAYGALALSTQYAGNFYERMRINSSGNVGIGTTNPGYLLHVAGSTANNTGVWVNLSDARLKKNVVPLANALSTISSLKPVRFQWTDAEMDKAYGTVRGLIAQDVEKVLPEWVKTHPSGYKALEPIGMDALLVEAIKELKAENDSLKARISALETKLESGH